MAEKITKETKLKVGELIAYKTTDGLAVFQIARLEKKKGMSVCVSLNSSPDDKKFIKENEVDWYTRIHQSDLVDHYKAELISMIELVMHFEHAQSVIRDLKRKSEE